MPRKVKIKYHYLYKTTNLINSKYYVGIHSTYKIKDGYLGSGTRLWNSIYKYGKENFIKEELEFFETREELLQREKEIVNKEFLQDPLCMNLQPGGGGGFSSKEHALKCTSASRKAFSERIKNDKELQRKYAEIGRNNWKKLRENGIRVGCDWTDKKHSEETKKKIGKANSTKQKAFNNSQYGTCWINDNRENKKIKREELDKWIIQGWQKGRVSVFTEEMKKKIGEKTTNNKGSCLGKIWIYKENLRKRINPIDLEAFKKEGWNKR